MRAKALQSCLTLCDPTTRLLHPQDSLGKNTGVSCHFLFQCMRVKSESEVAQSCPTLRDHMECSLPGSSVHGNSLGKNTRMGCHALLQGIFPYPGIKPRSLALQVDSLPVSHQGTWSCIYSAVIYVVQFSSVQFSCSVVSNSLRPHESQHTRPPCPSPTPGVHSDSRPSSQ